MSLSKFLEGEGGGRLGEAYQNLSNLASPIFFAAPVFLYRNKKAGKSEEFLPEAFGDDKFHHKNNGGLE